jgi:glycosyltransferase involved in cell wall biosynthesis
MIIAVNTRVLSADNSYTSLIQNSLLQLAAANSSIAFYFITETNFVQPLQWPSNVQLLVIPQQSTSPLLCKFWYNYNLPAALRKIKAQLLLHIDGSISVRTKIPQYTFVNDLNFLQQPAWYAGSYTRFAKSAAVAYLNRSAKVLVPSQHLKTQVMAQCKVPAAKITIWQPLLLPSFLPASWQKKETVKESYTAGREYFFCQAALHPRYYLLNLLKAFSLFKKRQKSNMQLVLAVPEAPANNEFVQSFSNYKYRNDVQLLQAPTQAVLADITAAAYASINLSPLYADISHLLHAQQCAVPVIAGNYVAAVDMLQETALFTNEQAVEQLAEKMMLLYKDEPLRNQLIQKGLANTQTNAQSQLEQLQQYLLL